MRVKLNDSTSLYLDLARILAALIVLLHHVFQAPYFYQNIHFPGRSAVIVFFVISGFVIAYASDGQMAWRSYALARLTRIYSVAVPALVLTATLTFLASLFWPSSSNIQYDHPVMRLLASLVFINHIWNLTIAAFSNGPYWSLCYEVWYYLVFGIAKFGRGLTRWLLIAAVLLAVGPRILLLMPIWGLGVGLYYAMKSQQYDATARSKWPFLLCMAAFLPTLWVYNPGDAASVVVLESLRDGVWQLGPFQIFIGGDWRFPSDYLLAILFAATIWFSAGSFSPAAPARWYGRIIRITSSYTFSLYLYHAPLLAFFYLCLGSGASSTWTAWALLALVLICTWALGRQTEHRKGPFVFVFTKLLYSPLATRS